MAKKFFPAFVAILQCLYFTLSAQGDSHLTSPRVYTSNMLKEDYMVLVKTLQEAYPSLYRYNTKKQVASFFSQNMSGLSGPMTERKFFPIIAATVAMMKDEHIIATPSAGYYDKVYKKQTRFLPFSLKIINNKLYVDKSIAPEITPGTEISAINNVAASSIIQKLIQHLHRDGYITTFLYRHLEDYSPTQNQNLFDLFYSFFYTLAPTAVLKVRKPNSRWQYVSCKTLNYPEYETFSRQRNIREAPFQYKPVSARTSYLSINSFHFSYRQFHKQDFDTLFESTFRGMQRDGVMNLVLDLRRCEGGDNAYLLLLSYLMTKPFRVFDYLELAYTALPSTAAYFENTENAFFIDSFVYRHNGGMYRLKKAYEATVPGYDTIYPRQHHFKGNIYVLTSGATGSAAGILSAILKSSGRAIFIGEETGGAMEGPTALNISTLVLPYSKIRIEIPHIRMQLATTHIKGRGVLPDYNVQNSVHDLIHHTDSQLQFALGLAEK